MPKSLNIGSKSAPMLSGVSPMQQRLLRRQDKRISEDGGRCLSYKVWSLVLLLCAGVSGYSLISGTSWLGQPLFAVLPLGNLLAWLGLLALPTAVWLVTVPGRRLWQAARLLWCLALPWLAISALLAGNFALVFGAGAQWQFQLWLLYSGVSVSVCSGLLLIICCWITEIRETAGACANTIDVSEPVNGKARPDKVS